MRILAHGERAGWIKGTQWKLGVTLRPPPGGSWRALTRKRKWSARTRRFGPRWNRGGRCEMNSDPRDGLELATRRELRPRLRAK